MVNNKKPLRDLLGSYQQIHPCLARIYSIELVMSIRDDIRSSFGMLPEMREYTTNEIVQLFIINIFKNFRVAPVLHGS